MMLEVPAAAISIDDMLPHVDFVSIGSNDLVQYLMAADRDNPKVSHLCQPLAPPVLRVLAHRHQGLQQGEQAGHALRRNGRPAAGLRAAVRDGPAELQHEPGLHSLDERTGRPPDRRIGPPGPPQALTLRTTAAVKRFMAEQLAKIAPNLRLMDTD